LPQRVAACGTLLQRDVITTHDAINHRCCAVFGRAVAAHIMSVRIEVVMTSYVASVAFNFSFMMSFFSCNRNHRNRKPELDIARIANKNM